MGRRTVVLAINAAIIAAIIAACSWALDWSAAGLPCDDNQRCEAGSSCLVNRCVEDGSLPLAATCNQSKQCQEYPDVTCGSAPFTCRKKCRSLYAPTDDCDSGYYCRPEPPRDSIEEWVGTCFPSECQSDDSCLPDRICVPINSSARACLVQCSYDLESGYLDNCGSTSEIEQYCQLIGSGTGQSTVCLESIDRSENRPGEGEQCNPLTNHCERGFVCYDGTCHRFCSTETTVNGCEAGEVCTAVPDPSASAMQVCK